MRTTDEQLEESKEGEATENNKGATGKRKDRLPENGAAAHREAIARPDIPSKESDRRTKDARKSAGDLPRRRIGRAAKRTRGARRRWADDLPQGMPGSQGGESDDLPNKGRCRGSQREKT